MPESIQQYNRASKIVELDYVTTRYQGSKRRIVNWIFEQIKELQYQTVLDAFSGTSSVAYEFKKRGKKVVCNDLLKSNYYTALALIENSEETLHEKDVSFTISKHQEFDYPTFIQNTFNGIYYTDEENAWLDMAITNIRKIENHYKNALALFALFQSCIIKRPFNLFHRSNLYLRLTKVERTFHNHKTWERPFSEYFKKFVEEANARVFSNGLQNMALNQDVLSIKETNFDLVYIDPPYISCTGKGINYYHLYHFLEGLCDYDNWSQKIDYTSKNLRLQSQANIWGEKKTAEIALDRIFKKFQDSILVVSYRTPGYPPITTIRSLLEQYKSHVCIHTKSINYALSKEDGNFETLLIGR